MRQPDKKYFGDVQQGRLNSDDSPFVVGTNEWVNAENIRTGSTDKGFTGVVESVGGNVELPQPPGIRNYFFNVDSAQPSYTSAQYQLGATPSSLTSSIGITITGNNIIAEFITDINEPNLTEIPAGIWNFSCVLKTLSTTIPLLLAEVYIVPPIAGVNGTLIGSSLPISINPLTTIGDRYNFSVNIPQTQISISDRIFIRFSISNSNNDTSFFPQALDNGNYYNFVTTNLVDSNTNYITIGSVEDTENKRIVYFNCDLSPEKKDRIICYYTESNKQYSVISSFQVVGGLNFSKDSIIHSAKISNGNILSWTDGLNNEPRKINIESGIIANDPSFITNENKYTFPLNFSEITLIKRPPTYTPNILKLYDSKFENNLIQYNSFEFAFQYQYYDNEVSVVGSYSPGSRLNYTTYTSPTISPNYIQVTMDSSERIPSTVKIINLIIRISDGNQNGGTNAFVVKTWDKNNDAELLEIQNHNAGVNSLVYDFYNNITGQNIASDDVLRAFDNVPIFSQTHEVSKDRFFLGNNINGYNTPTGTSLEVSFSNIVYPALLGKPFSVTKVMFSVFIPSDKPGNTATVTGSTWSYIGYYIWTTSNSPVYQIGVPIANSQVGTYTGWFMISEAFRRGSTRAWNSTGYVAPPAYPADPGIPSTIAATALLYRGKTQFQLILNAYIYYKVANISPSSLNFPFPSIGQSNNISYPPRLGVFPPTRDIAFPNVGTTNVTGILSNYYNIFPQISSYKFGVVFYDYAMRKCGVVPRTISNNQLYYKFDNVQVAGLAGGAIIFQDIIVSKTIFLGDIIVISGGTALDGTYTVINILLGTFTTFIVNPLAPSTSGYITANVSVYRASTQDLTTPPRDFDYSYAIGGMKWTLDTANSISEIPEWAYYYSVVRTLNLRTRFFCQSINEKGEAKYATKDPTTGDYIFTSTNYGISTIGVALLTTSLKQFGLGYSYAEGDIGIIIRNDNARFQLPVIAQSGNYIVLGKQDIGVTSNYSYTYEIYTPYKSSEQEPYYEVGEIYSVVNPSTPNRQYSVLSDILAADSYMFSRPYQSHTYEYNGMSPNDLFWKRWDSDAGKLNIITKLGQANKDTNISWSDTYISSTQINGSSTFRLGNETFVSDDCGSITKLQLTSKVQDQGQGSVMLALCNSEINSMYLGETQITDSTGKTQFFSSSSNVISTINVLKGNYGCISPESVVQYRGKVYFVDLSNGRVVQYSDNGLDAISNIKMSRFWKNWSYKYQSMTKAQIEAFGNRPYIFSIVDSSHDELLISLPKLSDDPPKGYLPDYPNTVYPFDILDYQGKTLVYCLGTAAQVYPHWQGAYTFTTENFSSLQNRLFSFFGGNIYEQNQSDKPNLFYGGQFSSKIMFTSNIFSQVPKVYDNFVVESNLMPSFVYFYNDYPYIQTSDLDDTSFINLEGIWYANILRNKIVPTATGFTTDGLLTAEVMRNTNMYVQTTFSPTTSPLELRLIQLGTSISKGHIIT